MSIGMHFMRSLLSDDDREVRLQNWYKALKRGVCEDYFLDDDGDARKIFAYVKKHLDLYGEVPFFAVAAVETDTLPPQFPVHAAFSYWLNALVTRYKEAYITHALALIQQYHEIGDARLRDATMQEMAKKVANLSLRHDGVDKLHALGHEVLEHHHHRQRRIHIPGVKFGVDFLDVVTGGAQPGDLWIVAGSSGSGKTLLSFRCALGAVMGVSPDKMMEWVVEMNATRQYNETLLADNPDTPLEELRSFEELEREPSKKVLYYSMEMSNFQMGQRGMAIGAAVSGTDIRMGAMTHYAVGKSKLFLDYWNAEGFNDNLIMIEGDVSMSVESIINMIDEQNPDIVFVDGAYMLHSENKVFKSQWEELRYVTEVLKRKALSKNIPIILSFQFNQKVKDEDKGIENIMGGQAIGQIASVVVGILSNPHDDPDSNFSGEYTKYLEIMKGRSGEQGAVVLHFDMVRTTIYHDFEDIKEGQDYYISLVGDKGVGMAANNPIQTASSEEEQPSQQNESVDPLMDVGEEADLVSGTGARAVSRQRREVETQTSLSTTFALDSD